MVVLLVELDKLLVELDKLLVELNKLREVQWLRARTSDVARCYARDRGSTGGSGIALDRGNMRATDPGSARLRCDSNVRAKGVGGMAAWPWTTGPGWWVAWLWTGPWRHRGHVVVGVV